MGFRNKKQTKRNTPKGKSDLQQLSKNQSKLEKQINIIHKPAPPPASPKPRKKTKKDYRETKRKWLIDNGYGVIADKLTANQIDSLPISKIRNGTLSPESVPSLFKAVKLDFYKRRSFPGDKKLYIAYRSLSWNNYLNDIIPRYAKLSNDELLNLAKVLLKKPLTYLPKVFGSSSGADGEARYIVGTSKAIQDEINQANHDTEDNKDTFYKILSGKLKRRYGHGDIYGYQELGLKGKTEIDSLTLNEALIIYDAIADNITEEKRATFNIFYYTRVFASLFPEIIPDLPSITEIQLKD